MVTVPVDLLPVGRLGLSYSEAEWPRPVQRDQNLGECGDEAFAPVTRDPHLMVLMLWSRQCSALGCHMTLSSRLHPVLNPNPQTLPIVKANTYTGLTLYSRLTAQTHVRSYSLPFSTSLWPWAWQSHRLRVPISDFACMKLVNPLGSLTNTILRNTYSRSL